MLLTATKTSAVASSIRYALSRRQGQNKNRQPSVAAAGPTPRNGPPSGVIAAAGELPVVVTVRAAVTEELELKLTVLDGSNVKVGGYRRDPIFRPDRCMKS